MPKSQKLKVGLVFDDTLDSNDGVAQYVKTLGAWLNNRGHKVSYLVGETKLAEWSGGKVYSLAKNQTIHFNGNKLSMPLPANKKRIHEVLEAEKFDVIHVMVPYSPFLAQRIINLAPAGTAIVGTFHIFPSGVLSKVGSRLLRILYGRSLSRFSQIVSVSPAAAKFADSYYGLDTVVVPNMVDLKKFGQIEPLSAKNDNPRIVFLGRLVKRKGVEQLIKAYSILAKELPETSLIIAGDGPNRKKLEKLAVHLGLDRKIEFLGYINEADKPKLLRSADIACFPSLYGEAFGIVLIEAMAAGAKVVLAGDNPGYSSVLGEQTKLLVDPMDAKVFAARLEELLNDQRVIDGLHRWQLEEVRQYDIDVVGRQILDVYWRAIARLNKNSHNKAHE